MTEASPRLRSYFFYFISILLFSLNRKQLQKKVAKYKHKPSRTLHGRKAGEKRFHAKTVWKNMKANSQTKSLKLGFLFKLLKIEEIYLIRIRIPSYHSYLDLYKSRRMKFLTTGS